MKSRPEKNFSIFILVSFSLHALFMCSILFSAKNTPPKNEIITMEIVETAPTVAMVAESPPAVKAPTKKVAEAVKIVDQPEKALNDDIDENTKFLSRHNQRVEKQTVAKNRGEFKNMTKEGPKGAKGSLEPKEDPMARFMPQFDVSKAVQERQAREQIFDAEAEKVMLVKQQRKKEAADLATAKKGTGDDAAQGNEVSQTLDYIKNLDPGIETILSSKEFKYYTYFSRVRQQLNQHWTPKVRSKVTQIYKSGRSIASTDDMITRCLITLDNAGKLIKVQIIGNSGVVELDEAAVEAFRSAAPFPNPPKGMVDSDGTIKLRWDFILEA